MAKAPEMGEIAIRDREGAVVEKREVPTPRPRRALIKQEIVREEANRRAGTASTKVRSQVSGSRRKPWRQKGTGRARHGDRQSPIWRGGGVIFGSHPRDFRQEIPKKSRRGAFRDVLAGKVRDGEVVAVDEFPLDPPKTREMAGLLDRLGVGGSCLIAVGPIREAPEGFDSADQAYAAVYRMSRNLSGVRVARIENLNSRDLLRHRFLLLSREGVEFLFPPKKAKEG